MNLLFTIFFFGGLWNISNGFLPISSKLGKLSNHPLKTQSKLPKQKPQNQTVQTPDSQHPSQIINAIAYRSPPSILISEQKTQHFTEADFHFQLQWYVIAETAQIHSDTLYEAKIWGKSYVYWKHENQYYAIQNQCNHRGASLSNGVFHPATNCVQCPYHGMEFNGDGILRNIPGQNIPPFSPPVWNQAKFPILEKEGWIYLNIVPSPISSHTPDEDDHNRNHRQMIFEELEASIPTARRVFYNIPSIPTYARIVSENLLDILHITYVHTFGNKNSPVPLNEPEIYKLRDIDPPSIPLKYPYPPSQPSPLSPATPQKSRTPPHRTISARIRAILFRYYLFAFLNGIFPSSQSSSPQNHPPPPSQKPQETQEPVKTPAKNQHYGIRYLFETNTQSMIRTFFQVNHILIETEFVLPHYTISRVRFGRYYKTVVSFALPVTETETHLFIKLYRNYWTRETIPSFPFPFSFFSVVIGLLLERMADYAMVWMLKKTFQEDAQILATLSEDGVQGSYHLKYDKFPFFYRNLYKKHVRSSVSAITNTNSTRNTEN